MSVVEKSGAEVASDIEKLLLWKSLSSLDLWQEIDTPSWVVAIGAGAEGVFLMRRLMFVPDTPVQNMSIILSIIAMYERSKSVKKEVDQKLLRSQLKSNKTYFHR